MDLELLVVGADGLDPRIVHYMVEKGKMPAISKLVDDGARIGNLASREGTQDNPHSGPAWTTIYTGLREYRHGVTFGGWIYGNISFENHYERTIFSELNSADYRVGSFTMPITYPATVGSDDGSWMLSGFPTVGLDESTVAPSDFFPMIPPEYGRYQASTLVGELEREDDLILDYAGIDQWIAAEQLKLNEILPRFIAKRPVDVLFYGTQVADTMGHKYQPVPAQLTETLQSLAEQCNEYFGTAINAPRISTLVWRKGIERTYELIDKIVSELVAEYQPQRLLLVSDHGFRLDGSGHSPLGVSLADGQIRRPQDLTEIRQVIHRSLGDLPMQNYGSTEREEIENRLSDSERAAIVKQLQALGYISDCPDSNSCS